MADFEPITTQEEMNERIKDRLQRAREKGQEIERKRIQRELLPILADLMDVIKGS